MSNVTVKNTGSVIRVDGEVAREILDVEGSRTIKIEDDTLKTHTIQKEVQTQAATVTQDKQVQTTQELLRLLAVAKQGPVGIQGPPGEGKPKSPQFTYTAGVLTRIDYEDSSYKLLTYDDGTLNRVDYVKDGATTRKEFVYDAGVLIAIQESVVWL